MKTKTDFTKMQTCIPDAVPLIVRLRRLYFKIFKCYRRLEFRAVSYAEGDKLIRESVGKPEAETWVLAPEEDNNRAFGLVVMLERRERILM